MKIRKKFFQLLITTVIKHTCILRVRFKKYVYPTRAWYLCSVYAVVWCIKCYQLAMATTVGR